MFLYDLDPIVVTLLHSRVYYIVADMLTSESVCLVSGFVDGHIMSRFPFIRDEHSRYYGSFSHVGDTVKRTCVALHVHAREIGTPKEIKSSSFHPA